MLQIFQHYGLGTARPEWHVPPPTPNSYADGTGPMEMMLLNSVRVVTLSSETQILICHYCAPKGAGSMQFNRKFAGSLPIANITNGTRAGVILIQLGEIGLNTSAVRFRAGLFL